jgi:hypothetical protein
MAKKANWEVQVDKLLKKNIGKKDSSKQETELWCLAVGKVNCVKTL